ncbi:hypothetical protein [Burkholderia gladioli]|uniref:hypothetical protein n=1 Tax=Burkholderia gladioli TaxID=28095 RepID=UPI0016416EB1|nr:hypothetical protein [Burkholderia gladioli]MDA0570165.1 hypothetical protein [Burkholderia gladioli]MDA0599857.1 hypothetical protein [Burkholderia gladioli]
MSRRPSRAFESNDRFVIRIVFDARAMLVCALVAAAMPQARAQAVPDVSGTAVIGANAARGISGVLSINETAGLDNAQANQLAIGIGSAAGAGVSSLQAAGAAAHTGDTSVRIEGGALSNLSGAAMVNQSAGSANLQRNSMAIGTLGVGIEAVSDSELSETAPKAGGLGIPAGGRDRRDVSISGDAFKHISGIVQVNQTAGAGNSTANSFVLRPPAGTLFIN